MTAPETRADLTGTAASVLTVDPDPEVVVDEDAATPAPPHPPGLATRLTDLLFVLAACGVVLAGVRPDLVLTDSMPLGTDLVGHAVIAWFDGQNPLSFLPGSWSDVAFNGFPVNELYPWLPTWLVGMASLVVPLSIAVKLGVVVPLVLLPWAAWRAASWSGLPRPLPVMLALGTVPFLFTTDCGACGGNVLSAVNGEYSFSWSLLFAVLALGAADRLATTGRGPWVTASLAALTAVSHPLPSVWLVVGIATVAIGREVWSRREARRPFALSALVALLLAASWWLPFASYRDWMPQNLTPRQGDVLTWLLPASTPWEVAVSLLAAMGLVWAVRRRSWLLIGYTMGAVVAVAAFLRFSTGDPFNGIRALPFWHLGRWSLAVVGFAWLTQGVVRRIRSDRTRPTDPRLAPSIWLITSIAVIGTTWGWWGLTTAPTRTTPGTATVLGQEFSVATASGAVSTTFSGFGSRQDYAELQSVQDLLRGVGQRYGCGTLMWDSGDVAAADPLLGDAQVFWQAPIWTDGCVTSADNVLVDSSMTAPAMQMTKTLVSQSSELLLPGRLTFDFSVDGGVSRMRAMGIRYYLTHGGQPAEEAAKTKGLSLVARGGPWQVWQVDQGVRAASLTSLPAVFEPSLSNAQWEPVTDQYFATDQFTDIPLVQDGLPAWPRMSLSALPAKVPTEAAGVSNIAVGNSSITFDVQRTGTPVIVRVSAFPGWQVTGADAVYRASANYLVVVPTSTTVTLTKSRTAIEWAAAALGLIGLALLVGLAVLSTLQRRSDRSGADSSEHAERRDPDADDAADPAGLGDGATDAARDGLSSEDPSGALEPTGRDLAVGDADSPSQTMG